ncbi:MAG: NAD(P)/FAD-dependent oxidoreductase [Alphaproteobacteria bacterium]|nr:NAD(P)/FAD-dependent oxidoreductase [Alphaproteobacteria bacterium]
MTQAPGARSRFADDDATIRAALEKASTPALMAAMVHITGSGDILRGPIRPSHSIFRDLQGGISKADQATVRARALAVLKAYRDGDGQLPPAPGPARVHEMVNFVIGREVPAAYVDFLLTELSLDGADPYGHPGLDDIPSQAREQFQVVIIGAGMSGILAAIRLRQAGIPYVIMEKNKDVGGTWLQNTYPGCRVDSSNHTYSYSFAPKDWPQPYSNQKTLLQYFDDCATEHGIRGNTRFNTEVTTARYDETTNTWQLEVGGADGGTEVITANAVIAAVGQLNRPKFPDLPGRDGFFGASFHSARWNHAHNLTGNRVAVVGTGASAFQFVPEIAKQAREVFVFQRTPPWMIPTPDYHDDVAAETHWLLNNVPFYDKWFRFWMFWASSEGLLSAVKADPDWDGSERSISAENDGLRLMLTEYIKQLVGDDKELLAKAIPDYPVGGKRILRDNGNWIRALKRDNVHVITDPIEAISPAGVRTRDGTDYKVETLIYGTGYQANRFLSPMKITGMGGVDLHDHWGEDPRAYLGMTMPGFPNFFCLYGPNTNIVVNGSIIFFSECEVRYVLGCLAMLLRGNHGSLDCKREVHDAYNREIDAGNQAMAWGSDKVTSWYKNSQGRVTQNWPFTLLDFWTRTKAPNPDDYIFS